MANKQGPSIRNIPAQREQVCNGCEFLKTSGGMKGHRHVTNDFACTHPDFSGEQQLMSGSSGRTIHFNHEGSCETPYWCPFLKPKQNEQTETTS